MPFDDNQDKDNTNNNQNLDQGSPNADDKSAQQHQQQGFNGDHNQVFLVAGERAFKSPEDVIKNIENAQSHIQTLEAERAADREKQTELQAELERLRKIEASLDGRDNNSGKADQTDQLSKEEIAKHAADLALGIIQNSQSEAEKTANLVESEKLAAAAYGEDYKLKVVEAAAALGMSPQQVDELGKDNPKAFQKLFIPADAETATPPSRGSVNVNDLEGKQAVSTPKNILKMRSEKDRISHVSERMKAAGVDGY